MLDQHLYLIDTLKSFCVKINLSFLNDSIFIYVLPYIQTLFMDIYILFSLGSLLFPGMGPKLRGQEGCLEQCSKRNANHIQKTVTGKLNLRRHVLRTNSTFSSSMLIHSALKVIAYCFNKDGMVLCKNSPSSALFCPLLHPWRYWSFT